MKKSQFIELVAERAEMSKAAAARVVDAIFDTAGGAISEAVRTAGQLSIPGFGKFSSKTRAAREGRNPRTGTVIQIPERTTVSFSPGKGFRETMSGGGAAAGAAGGTGATAKSRTAGSARKAAGGATKTAAASTAAAGAGATAKKSTAKKSAADGGTAGAAKSGTATKTAAKTTGPATKSATKGATKTGGTKSAKK
ncbi:MAG TPA: HU family DNA-binding protein [Longimicrobiaceae bacterium]|jgi:DNA-binding protein HU-beta